MRSATNQKLTDQQIATIKHLKSNGVRISIISQVLSATYGVSPSTAYYHASENRDSYDYRARKIREAQLQKTKEKIYAMIQEGMTTGQIACSWNMPLATVNKIYTR